MKDRNWLEIKNLEAWNCGSCIFNNINLSIKENQNVAILGPNGSGKSSLLKLISRNIYPVVKENSYLKVFGSENIKLSTLRSKIGFVDSLIERMINPNKKVIEIITTAFFQNTYLSKFNNVNNDQIKKIEMIINKFDLVKLKHKSFGHLSEGEKRKVIIARALVHNPLILILDEPFSRLDIKAKSTLLSYLEQVSTKNLSLVQVTHNFDSIIRNIDRVILLKSGKIFADGNKENILTSEMMSKLFSINIDLIRIDGIHYPSSISTKN